MATLEPSLTSQLASLKRHRAPLAASLRALADDAAHGRSSDKYRRLAQMIEDGLSLSEAVGNLGDRQLKPLAALLAADLSVDAQVRLLGIWESQELELRRHGRKLWAVLWYPLIVAVLALIVAAWLVALIGDVADTLFDSAAMRMPFPMPTLVEMGPAMRHRLPVFAAAATLFIALFVTVPLRRGQQRLLYWIPFVGPVLRWHVWTGFLRMLGALAAARVPMPRALRTLELQFHKTGLRRVASRLAEQVEQGRSLGEACQVERRFPRELVPFLKNASSSDELDTALRAAAKVSAQRFELYSSLARRVLPVLSLFAVALIVAVCFGSLGLLLVQLVRGLAG